MQTDALQPNPPAHQSHSLIASDRVEGTPVRRSDGRKVGAIQRLMIDKLSGNVAYAVLSFGGFFGIGQKHLPGRDSSMIARSVPISSTSPTRNSASAIVQGWH